MRISSVCFNEVAIFTYPPKHLHVLYIVEWHHNAYSLKADRNSSVT